MSHSIEEKMDWNDVSPSNKQNPIMDSSTSIQTLPLNKPQHIFNQQQSGTIQQQSQQSQINSESTLFSSDTNNQDESTTNQSTTQQQQSSNQQHHQHQHQQPFLQPISHLAPLSPNVYFQLYHYITTYNFHAMVEFLDAFRGKYDLNTPFPFSLFHHGLPSSTSSSTTTKSTDNTTSQLSMGDNDDNNNNKTTSSPSTQQNQFHNHNHCPLDPTSCFDNVTIIPTPINHTTVTPLLTAISLNPQTPQQFQLQKDICHCLILFGATLYYLHSPTHYTIDINPELSRYHPAIANTYGKIYSPLIECIIQHKFHLLYHFIQYYGLILPSLPLSTLLLDPTNNILPNTIVHKDDDNNNHENDDDAISITRPLTLSRPTTSYIHRSLFHLLVEQFMLITIVSGQDSQLSIQCFALIQVWLCLTTSLPHSTSLPKLPSTYSILTQTQNPPNYLDINPLALDVTRITQMNDDDNEDGIDLNNNLNNHDNDDEQELINPHPQLESCDPPVSINKMNNLFDEEFILTPVLKQKLRSYLYSRLIPSQQQQQQQLRPSSSTTMGDNDDEAETTTTTTAAKTKKGKTTKKTTRKGVNKRTTSKVDDDNVPPITTTTTTSHHSKTHEPSINYWQKLLQIDLNTFALPDETTHMHPLPDQPHSIAAVTSTTDAPLTLTLDQQRILDEQTIVKYSEDLSIADRVEFRNQMNLLREQYPDVDINSLLLSYQTGKTIEELEDEDKKAQEELNTTKNKKGGKKGTTKKSTSKKTATTTKTKGVTTRKRSMVDEDDNNNDEDNDNIPLTRTTRRTTRLQAATMNDDDTGDDEYTEKSKLSTTTRSKRASAKATPKATATPKHKLTIIKASQVPQNTRRSTRRTRNTKTDDNIDDKMNINNEEEAEEQGIEIVTPKRIITTSAGSIARRTRSHENLHDHNDSDNDEAEIETDMIEYTPSAQRGRKSKKNNIELQHKTDNQQQIQQEKQQQAQQPHNVSQDNTINAQMIDDIQSQHFLSQPQSIVDINEQVLPAPVPKKRGRPIKAKKGRASSKNTSPATQPTSSTATTAAVSSIPASIPTTSTTTTSSNNQSIKKPSKMAQQRLAYAKTVANVLSNLKKKKIQQKQYTLDPFQLPVELNSLSNIDVVLNSKHSIRTLVLSIFDIDLSILSHLHNDMVFNNEIHPLYFYALRSTCPETRDLDTIQQDDSKVSKSSTPHGSPTTTSISSSKTINNGLSTLIASKNQPLAPSLQIIKNQIGILSTQHSPLNPIYSFTCYCVHKVAQFGTKFHNLHMNQFSRHFNELSAKERQHLLYSYLLSQNITPHPHLIQKEINIHTPMNSQQEQFDNDNVTTTTTILEDHQQQQQQQPTNVDEIIQTYTKSSLKIVAPMGNIIHNINHNYIQFNFDQNTKYVLTKNDHFISYLLYSNPFISLYDFNTAIHEYCNISPQFNSSSFSPYDYYNSIDNNKHATTYSSFTTPPSTSSSKLSTIQLHMIYTLFKPSSFPLTGSIFAELLSFRRYDLLINILNTWGCFLLEVYHSSRGFLYVINSLIYSNYKESSIKSTNPLFHMVSHHPVHNLNDLTQYFESWYNLYYQNRFGSVSHSFFEPNPAPTTTMNNNNNNNKDSKQLFIPNGIYLNQTTLTNYKQYYRNNDSTSSSNHVMGDNDAISTSNPISTPTTPHTFARHLLPISSQYSQQDDNEDGDNSDLNDTNQPTSQINNDTTSITHSLLSLSSRTRKCLEQFCIIPNQRLDGIDTDIDSINFINDHIIPAEYLILNAFIHHEINYQVLMSLLSLFTRIRENRFVSLPPSSQSLQSTSLESHGYEYSRLPLFQVVEYEYYKLSQIKEQQVDSTNAIPSTIFSPAIPFNPTTIQLVDNNNNNNEFGSIQRNNNNLSSSQQHINTNESISTTPFIPPSLPPAFQTDTSNLQTIQSSMGPYPTHDIDTNIPIQSPTQSPTIDPNNTTTTNNDDDFSLPTMNFSKFDSFSNIHESSTSASRLASTSTSRASLLHNDDEKDDSLNIIRAQPKVQTFSPPHQPQQSNQNQLTDQQQQQQPRQLRPSQYELAKQQQHVTFHQQLMNNDNNDQNYGLGSSSGTESDISNNNSPSTNIYDAIENDTILTNNMNSTINPLISAIGETGSITTAKENNNENFTSSRESLIRQEEYDNNDDSNNTTPITTSAESSPLVNDFRYRGYDHGHTTTIDESESEYLSHSPHHHHRPGSITYPLEEHHRRHHPPELLENEASTTTSSSTSTSPRITMFDYSLNSTSRVTDIIPTHVYDTQPITSASTTAFLYKTLKQLGIDQSLSHHSVIDSSYQQLIDDSTAFNQPQNQHHQQQYQQQQQSKQSNQSTITSATNIPPHNNHDLSWLEFNNLPSLNDEICATIMNNDFTPTINNRQYIKSICSQLPSSSFIHYPLQHSLNALVYSYCRNAAYVTTLLSKLHNIHSIIKEHQIKVALFYSLRDYIHFCQFPSHPQFSTRTYRLPRFLSQLHSNQSLSTSTHANIAHSRNDNLLPNDINTISGNIFEPSSPSSSECDDIQETEQLQQNESNQQLSHIETRSKSHKPHHHHHKHNEQLVIDLSTKNFNSLINNAYELYRKYSSSNNVIIPINPTVHHHHHHHKHKHKQSTSSDNDEQIELSLDISQFYPTPHIHTLPLHLFPSEIRTPEFTKSIIESKYKNITYDQIKNLLPIVINDILLLNPNCSPLLKPSSASTSSTSTTSTSTTSTLPTLGTFSPVLCPYTTNFNDDLQEPTTSTTTVSKMGDNDNLSLSTTSSTLQNTLSNESDDITLLCQRYDQLCNRYFATKNVNNKRFQLIQTMLLCSISNFICKKVHKSHHIRDNDDDDDDEYDDGVDLFSPSIPFIHIFDKLHHVLMTPEVNTSSSSPTTTSNPDETNQTTISHSNQINTLLGQNVSPIISQPFQHQFLPGLLPCDIDSRLILPLCSQSMPTELTFFFTNLLNAIQAENPLDNLIHQ